MNLKVFLKFFLFIFFIIVLFKNSSIYSFDRKNFFFEKIQIKVGQEESIFQNKKKPISIETINEVKKSQILILIVVTFFVFGFLFLIYHLKKIRIINQQLENYSRENEFLISETNHRVNNNLQLISFLISDKLRKKQSEENRNDFIKLLSKVEAIASLHRHLYQSKSKNEIDLKQYLLEVKNNFNEIQEDNHVEIRFKIAPIQVNSDNAMYIGLLVTELIINSFKYAFAKDQKKSIVLKINKENDIMFFDYNDNGKNALEQEINPKLATQLCQQLKVNPIIETSKGFHLYFNVNL